MEETIEKLINLGTPIKLPRKTFQDLELSFHYSIKNLKGITTRYGYKLIATLLDHTWEEFELMLPDRFRKLSDNDIQELNKIEDLYLTYTGIQNNTHMIKFSRNESWEKNE